MWVTDSSLDTISFRELYQFRIQAILKENYCPYPASMNETSYDLIELEITNLIDAYQHLLSYKPTIPLYHNHKKISMRVPISLRLNSIAYALHHIPNAYYQLSNDSTFFIQPHTRPSSMKYYIKTVCIGIVLVSSYLFYLYEFRIHFYYLLLSLCVLCVAWTL